MGNHNDPFAGISIDHFANKTRPFYAPKQRSIVGAIIEAACAPAHLAVDVTHAVIEIIVRNDNDRRIL